ncbi:ribosome biogenesis GTPase YqeH [Tetragenococcus halophilus]|uniref:Ribosome biogenesis GTPase YqeH n=1 Tax=Tetragenococcus halophilus TaxID=51669 RepID=A0A3G5FIY3_TETHA|nr:ribosome biogenesis GTPase YqeH [Tetragenococcus halophilus]AYW50302.1 ribosome biogenesis GTPase YqeH [Tetragenococcus halophilus]MCO8288352.1 ribosome biogenesis GTPase YqeH [Tetragenococcus halophilus]GBD63507.1 putative GTP-binding protein [Tetragenococcus halophilus subsp. flandriensis]GMG64985.1 ribosome biogenesis GTPase YqeH [Tetragenococcus halophilus]GMQ73566.1 ribosome biogenesis GTPase YqeH [Tetragenococcus halophilus]
MTEALQCIGCGAVIQTEDKNKIGYTPKSVLEKGLESGEVYCQRCFRLRHYNEIQDVSLTDDDFLRLLNEIGQKDALIVNVVDIFDFNGSIIPGLHRFVGDNPVLLVGNKVDVLPKSLKKTKLKQWMKEQAHDKGLRPVDVLLTSAKRNDDLDTLLDMIEKYREGRDVYIVGVTNVGKSTLINQIVQKTADVKELITTSKFPGTTLDKIEIPLEDGQFLIDTPGIIHHHQMAHFLGEKDLKIIAPQKEIKPKIYQLNAGQTLFLGGLARFDFIKGEKSSFTVFVSNDLMIHRTKLENADKFYEKHLGELLQPPRNDEKEHFPELERFEFSIKEKTDIVFAGLGWVTVKDPVVVSGWAPKGVDVITRQALV